MNIAVMQWEHQIDPNLGMEVGDDMYSTYIR